MLGVSNPSTTFSIANPLKAYSYQLLADTLRELRPDLDEYIPLGTPGGSLPPPSEIDNSKSETELGLKCEFPCYRSAFNAKPNK